MGLRRESGLFLVLGLEAPCVRAVRWRWGLGVGSGIFWGGSVSVSVSERVVPRR